MTWRRLAFWGVATAFPLPLVLTYHAVSVEPVALRTDVSYGMVAYGWWLMSIMLSVRPSWLDRLVGLPAIYGLHGMLGVLAIGAAYLHHEDAFASEALARNLGNVAFWSALALLSYSIFFMSGWLGDRSRRALRTKASLERFVRHQLSLWVHRANLVVVGMVFLHAHLLDRVNQHLPLMVLLDLYTVGALSLYAWKKWIAPDAFLTGEVVRNEARGVATRVLSVALDREATRAQPGDSVFLRFEGSSVVGREWHPFSLSDDDRSTLTFTISQHGDFTRRLSTVEHGTRVRLEGPFGRFEAIAEDLDPGVPLVLLGMGAGVAPLLSLTAAHHQQRRLELLWSVRSADHALYEHDLDRYQEASGGLLRVVIKVGRFDRQELVRRVSPEALAHGTFFVVGPSPAVLASCRMLRRAGVPRHRIHHERLTL